ncbi:MAG TPA: hypothetical protein VKV27_04115 [Solirubrobacteraceae bacterium]|nr:hypothetical protein [Solirubrobacteraceae bacterium]
MGRSPRAAPRDGAASAAAGIVDACRYCARREHLRRTARIALAVGLALTAINQGGVIVSGKATTATAVRCALNFLVPFIVSNLGLLSGRSRGADRDRG